MLQSIRDKAQGWIAWAIVILIAIPFAFWGIDSYLGGGSEPIVAEVNGQEISERDLDFQYQNFRRQLRERLGGAFQAELFDETKMRNEVLDNMIRDTVLMQASADMGLAASDRDVRGAILSEPAFQRSGQFDKANYERVLQLQGMVPQQFEERLRQRLLSTQLSRLVAASELVTERELVEAVRLLRQKRAIAYATLPAARFMSDEPVPDADISAYYESHLDDYRTPEQVRLAYILVDSETLGATDDVTEEELRGAYEAERDRFLKPEQRSVRHILIQVPPGADDSAQQAARERAEAIRVRIEGGEDFAELARELSEDPGSAPQGGDLGPVEPGTMDPVFEQSAYALAQGALSEPVRSAFGYHIIRVDSIIPESIKTFEEVKGELAAEAQKKHAENRYFEVAERLANLTFEHPDSLEPAAEALGLQVQTSDWISREGGAGLLGHPKVLAAAFADDVLGQGNNSELIEPERDLSQALVVRVVEHREASARALEGVREDVEKAIRVERARETAKKTASELVAKLREGEGSLADFAADYALTPAGLVARDTQEVPQAVRDLAFTLPVPASGKPRSYGETILANGDAVVVEVTEVQDGSLDGLTAEERNQEEQRLERTLGRQYYDRLLADLVSRAKVERKAVTAGRSQ